MRSSLVFSAVLLLVGCGSPFSPAPSIADVVRIQGVKYLHCPAPQCTLAESEVGSEHGKVARQIPSELVYAGHRLQDGEATLLSAGTVLYRVNGHIPENRLVARWQESLHVYSAMEAP